MANKTITWQPVFTREGFPYFILSLGLEGYVKDMSQALGWGYRDQLFISQNNIEKSYSSDRDSASFQKFIDVSNERVVRRLNAKIRRIFFRNRKHIQRLYAELGNKPEAKSLALRLREFYRCYREMYSVYRFPTLVDMHRHDFPRPTISDCGRTKDYCGKIFSWVDDNVMPAFAAALGKILGVEKKRTLFMNYQELAESLRLGKPAVSPPELEKRYRLYVLLAVSGKIALLVGQRAVKLRQRIEREVLGAQRNNAGSLHGQTAYATQKPVIGIARVVRTLQDLKKLRGQYVIITPMTTVRFTQYLRHAKAVITDEGGLTCHAAVIARELKIPCIVGTKIATEVLKNGDYIEVDAAKAVVRKI